MVDKKNFRLFYKSKNWKNVPLDALIRNIKDVMRSRYVDVKGAAFMIISEYVLSEKMTVEVYKAYLRNHLERRG